MAGMGGKGARAMIDWDRVATLRQDVGDDGFMEVVGTFLEEVEEALALLPDHPPEALAAALHFLKGGALNLGFAEVAAFCELGEREANAGRAAAVDRAQVQELYERSRVSFLSQLAVAGAGPVEQTVPPQSGWI